MPDSTHIAVVGGGICGLACGYRLQQLGVSVTVFEASNRPGGLVGTAESDGFLLESGPQSFQGTETILQLIGQLGITDELCAADARAPRFVLRRGRLQPIPMSPQALLTSSLLGAGSRWKVLSEPLRRSRPPSEEESVANFVRRKFGHEILEYLVSPFVSGVYAGDPEKLSLKAAFPTLEQWEREYGSVLRGALKSRSRSKDPRPPSLCSFKTGVASLARALADKLANRLRVGTHVCAVNRSPQGRFEILADCGGHAETISVSGVVMATPAYMASRLLHAVSAEAAASLSGISYAGVGVVASGYYEKQMRAPLRGFGFLVPRSEKLRILGTVWNSSLFPGRAPEGSVLITSFVGGATDPDILSKSEQELAALVHTENARVLQISGLPLVSQVWKHPRALPQYDLGHHHQVEALRRAEVKNPGIFFSGNYLEGPSLGNCIEQGFKTAEAAKDFLGVPR